MKNEMIVFKNNKVYYFLDSPRTHHGYTEEQSTTFQRLNSRALLFLLQYLGRRRNHSLS